MRTMRCGDRALLVELDDLQQVVDLHGAAAGRWPGGVLDLIPAARTLLVRFDPDRTSPAAVSAWLAESATDEAPRPQPADRVVIPVRYDGEDLAEVGRVHGLNPAEVVARHLAGEYTVAFCGFTPGFAYLTGLDPLLHVPRRSVPRTRVPAGAVALADEFAGIYPRESPGGWQIIGRTSVALFDLTRDPPALLTPGTRVRFIEVVP